MLAASGQGNRNDVSASKAGLPFPDRVGAKRAADKENVDWHGKAILAHGDVNTSVSAPIFGNLIDKGTRRSGHKRLLSNTAERADVLTLNINNWQPDLAA